MRDKESIGVNDQRIWHLPGDRVEGYREIRRLAHFMQYEAKAEMVGGFAHFLHEVLAGTVRRVPQHGDPGRARRQLMEQLQVFSPELRDHGRETGNVPTG